MFVLEAGLYNKGMKSGSEEIRLRHLYRKMILDGRVRISFEAARRPVGPDCAHHLYGKVRLKRKRRAG